jgi:hypothetical protein
VVGKAEYLSKGQNPRFVVTSPSTRKIAARKLMREAGIQVRHRKKFKVTTNSNHKHPVFDNVLNREFDVAQTTRRMLLM